MGDVVQIKSKWNLTRDAFDRFLACLDGDREQAGLKYEKIRLKLIRFFEWRRVQFAEEHADETINRVVRKIGAGETIREPTTYIYGVARMLLLEILKEQEKRQSALDQLSFVQEPEDEGDRDAQLEGLKRCLHSLTPEGRELIMAYYEEDKSRKIENRKALAERFGISHDTLRVRALRLREKLEKCLRNCLYQRSTKPQA